MKLSEYTHQALRTESNDWRDICIRVESVCCAQNLRLLHASLGLASETGEIAEAIFPEASSPLDRVNVLEELGDVLWYTAIACDAVELDLAKLADFGGCYGVIFDPPLGLVTGLGLLAMRGGAVADILKKHVFYGQPLDVAALEDALARVLWVIGFCAAHLGKNIDEVAAANIAKLQARYPERFTAEAAATRDLGAERKALEKTDTETGRRGDAETHPATPERLAWDDLIGEFDGFAAASNVYEVDGTTLDYRVTPDPSGAGWTIAASDDELIGHLDPRECGPFADSDQAKDRCQVLDDESYAVVQQERAETAAEEAPVEVPGAEGAR